jgi:hypothetical protein
MNALDWPTAGPLAEVRPVSDLVLLAVRDAARDVRVHDHPASTDLYCLNLLAFMGERMAAVLRRLADAEAEVRTWKDRCAALADDALKLAGEAPPGPADADPVWVTTGRAGIPMHRITDPAAATTACGRATRAGRVTTAANAIVSWDSPPCDRCWPGATS